MHSKETSPSRRTLLKTGLGLAASAAALAPTTAQSNKISLFKKKRGARKGRINQSVVSWCFAKHWSTEKMCRVASDLGCKSIELIAPDQFPILGKHGLTCAITPIDMGGPPFVQGWNNPKYHQKVGDATRKAIDAASEFGSPNVIAFNGYAEDVSLDDGVTNCVKGLKGIAGYAEKKKVTLAWKCSTPVTIQTRTRGIPATRATILTTAWKSSRRSGPPT